MHKTSSNQQRESIINDCFYTMTNLSINHSLFMPDVRTESEKSLIDLWTFSSFGVPARPDLANIIPSTLPFDIIKNECRFSGSSVLLQSSTPMLLHVHSGFDCGFNPHSANQLMYN